MYTYDKLNLILRYNYTYNNYKVSFWFVVTPCVYLNYREAEVHVQVLKRTLSHNSYLDCH